jgi:hypothetical protein
MTVESLPDGSGFHDVLGCELPADHVGQTSAVLTHHAPGVARYAARVRPVGDRPNWRANAWLNALVLA